MSENQDDTPRIPLPFCLELWLEVNTQPRGSFKRLYEPNASLFVE